MRLTWCGRPMNSGRAERNAARTPDTCGAAIDVPDCSAYAGEPWSAGSPACAASSPHAAEAIHSPGATTSGFIRPSRVGPLPEVQVTPKVCGASRWVEPTAMQSSAWAGSVIEPITAEVLAESPAAVRAPLLPE